MAGISSCCFASSDNSKSVRSFWLLGMINNAPWFLMNAVATNISAGGVALVFIANMLPGLAINISAPYWFHLVSYKIRILSAASAMGAACIFVGCGGLFQDDLKGENEGPKENQRLGLGLQLFGVSLMSIASNMGEVSLFSQMKIVQSVFTCISAIFYQYFSFLPEQGLITGSCWEV